MTWQRALSYRDEARRKCVPCTRRVGMFPGEMPVHEDVDTAPIIERYRHSTLVRFHPASDSRYNRSRVRVLFDLPGMGDAP